MDEHAVQSSSVNSSGGWAIIHGGETAAMLDEQVGGRSAAATVAAAGLHFSELLSPEYVSAPSNAQPPTASTSRTPTGSGIALRVFDGGEPRAAGDPGGDGTAGSEQLFRQNGATFLVGNGSPRVSPSPSPSGGGAGDCDGGGGGGGGDDRAAALSAPHGHARAAAPLPPPAGHSPLPQGAAPEGPYVTGAAWLWEACTLEQSLKGAMRAFDENGAPDRKRRLLWRGLRIR